MSEREESHTILLVEDDPSLALGLVDTLEFEGFRVLHTRFGKQGVALANAENPECIILDLMLPDMNGYQICEQIRRTNSRVPILILTARAQESDKIRGLDAGADDYVTKPFAVGELVARVRALFRRVERSAGAPGSAPFDVGAITIDPRSHTLHDGVETLPLSFYEVQILRLLHERAGEVLSRDEILDRIWGIEASPTNRTVDNFIAKIRKKVEPQPDRPRHIVTVYGVGYKLVP